MRHQDITTAASSYDFVRTQPFAREDLITTPFRRAPVDRDDTVPVELYSQPYERVEVAPDSKPYELIEIAAVIEQPAPSAALRIVLTISLLACALVAGFELALLVL